MQETVIEAVIVVAYAVTLRAAGSVATLLYIASGMRLTLIPFDCRGGDNNEHGDSTSVEVKNHLSNPTGGL